MLDPGDTSDADDVFIGGYIAALLNGADWSSAASAGHALAAWTIMRPDVIPTKDS